jgi:hypothetical protein
MGRNCTRSESVAISVPQSDAARILTKILDISDWDLSLTTSKSGRLLACVFPDRVHH